MPAALKERLAYTVEETANALGVSVTTVYRMVENGSLPHKRLPGRGTGERGRIIILADALRKWISQPDEPRQITVQKNAEKIAKDAARKLRSVR
jgi:excisionase family DNA binding protein